MTTLVLVHGAGHTSRVWRRVQDELRHPSLAVDLPGRRDRPDDITRVTIDAAAASVAAAAEALTGTLVLVGHSVGGIVLPATAARLGGRVEHLVFVAGLVAAHDARVIDSVRPGDDSLLDARLAELRAAHGGKVLHPVADGPSGHPELNDVRVAMGIDSLNYMAQTVSWRGVDPSLPRTFVRCTRDEIQPPELQARLVENCAATTVIDLDSGHTPALDRPQELAAILDRIAGAPERRLPEARRGIAVSDD